jgi:hypothetical protein
VLSDISGRAAIVITDFSDAPALNILTLQLGQNDFIATGPYVNDVARWVTDVQTLLVSYRTGAGGTLLKIGLTTQNPRNDATFLGTRTAVNNAILGLVKDGYADFLVEGGGPDVWARRRRQRPHQISGRHSPVSGQPKQHGGTLLSARAECTLPRWWE